METEDRAVKEHRKRQAGRKAEKKKKKTKVETETEEDAKKRNPKAFAYHSINKVARQVRRAADVDEKKHHIPLVARVSEEPPPIVVAVVGPPRVGKTTLLTGLVQNFTRQKVNNIAGPITIVAGKTRRLTFIECRNDLSSMIDVAKVCDLALLLIDASFGFEMETFEFLNICQVHGFPKVIGVLTHLDTMKDNKQMRKTKKKLKQRFWTEIVQGAKLFYLTKLQNDQFLKRELHNLGRFISVIKFRPQPWRMAHPYVLVDRVEDLTEEETVRVTPSTDRRVALYGYVRGSYLQAHAAVHIPGVGDTTLSAVQYLPDPCELPTAAKKRSLDYRERLMYAPFSGLGGVVYDKDGVYIETGGSHHQKQARQGETGQLLGELRQQMAAPRMRGDVTLLSRRPALQSSPGDDGSTDEGDSEMDSDEEPMEDFEDNGSDDNGEAPDVSHLVPASITADKMPVLSVSRSLARRVTKSVYEAAALPGAEEGDDGDDFGGLFSLARQKLGQSRSLVADTEDCSQSHEEARREISDLTAFLAEHTTALQNCFVTGKWSEEDDAEARLAADSDGASTDEESDSEKSGEDAEGDDNEEGAKSVEGEAAPAKGGRMAKKRRMKENFDRIYDEMKGGTTTHYEEVKGALEQQAELNRKEFAGLDEETRCALEGHRPGMYVRVELSAAPAELMLNFDPTYPLIIGGLATGEQQTGCVSVRLKRHRWHKRTLKARDPLIVSCGWRRFQTCPLYAVQEHNMRLRSLKYTPDGVHCNAVFWGPISPQGTSCLAVQTLCSTPDFRIAATGTVMELDKSLQVMKKLKLLGEPHKIYKKTAFIKGMFSSTLEAAKFEGALIRTVSGIRGQIKKADRDLAGCVRCTFEDKILPADIIFLRTWYQLEVPRMLAPVTNLLSEDKTWTGMKTVGQMRYERGLKAPTKEDSLYQPVVRKERFNLPLRLPKLLSSQLPFKMKRITSSSVKDTIQSARPAIIRDAREQKVATLMTDLRRMNADRQQKANDIREKKLKIHAKKVAKEEALKLFKRKEIKKKIYRSLGKKEAAQENKGKRGSSRSRDDDD